MHIGVVGANGQVGAELCLLLSRQSGVKVVPVCRNRFGSAYLRYRGLPYRHGSVADAEQAAGLLGDCQVVVNTVSAHGLPRQVRETHRRIIRNSTRCSAPDAKIIFFSTMSVYGDPREGVWPRWNSAYGREKLACEREQRRVARACGKPCWNLRLGHVCGELQSITRLIREEIRSGRVVLPERDRVSNTVYTATIVDAVLLIAAGRVPPGTYDLMSQPEWTWREVYEFEAGRCGLPLTIVRVPEAPRPGRLLPLPALLRTASYLARSDVARQLVRRAMRWLPPRLNGRIQAFYYRNRAAADIAALQHQPFSNEAVTWVAQGRRFIPGLATTRELLERREFSLPPFDPARSWPADLPQASPLQSPT